MFNGLKVYISSTSIDLADYRRVVIAALRKSGFVPICMEDYVAQDTLPVDKCLADVAQSDLYVGIFAWRYGFIPPGHEKSITELEYRKAVEKSIPTLIFLLDEKADWPSEYCDTRQHADRISALREEFQIGKMISLFPADPHQLASIIQAALARYEREILNAQIAKLQSERYAEISVASTPEQSASVQQAITLLQEAMKQQAIQAGQSTRNPIPILLPKLRGVFVDREAERDTLYHSLISSDQRLVVIVAPGGYGKTELTAKVLSEIAPSNHISRDDIQGILYLKCVRGDITLGQIFSEAGRIAGKRDEFQDVYANKELSLARKLEYFFSELSKAGNVWIVMDNFEDLLDPSDDSIRDEEIREFLETSAGVEHTIRMIVTSRAVPRFKGSRKLEKIDLSKGLPEEQAIRYLREEGQEYGLDKEDEKVLCSFVRRVHCIPKALESVIGYLEEHYPSVTLRDIVADQSFFVDFDRHDYEKGLKKLIFEQIRNQTADAQLLLSVLSIFSKPSPLAALRYMLPAIGPAEFASLMTRLEKNRLLIQNNGYYDLHPVVRSFVYDRIPETETGCEGSKEKSLTNLPLLSRPGLHKRAAGFFHELRKPKEEWKSIDDLDPQLQEIHHLMKAEQYGNVSDLLKTIDFNYLQAWGYARIVIGIREQLIDKLMMTEKQQTNIGYLGLAYRKCGQLQRALECTKDALTMAQQRKNMEDIHTWLNNVGLIYWELMDMNQAISFYKQAIDVARKSPKETREGRSLSNLGLVYEELGKLNESVVLYERALNIAERNDDERGKAARLRRWGCVCQKKGDYASAIDKFRQAHDIATRRGLMETEILAFGDMANVYLCRGETEIAFSYFDSALAKADAYGDPVVTAAIMRDYGFAHHYLGHLEKAFFYYYKSISFQAFSSSFSCLTYLGILCFENSSFGDANKYLNNAYEQCSHLLQKTHDLLSARYSLALALLGQGKSEEARQSYQKALNICSAKGVVKKALMDLALLERAAPETHGLLDVKYLLNDAMAKSGDGPGKC